MRGTKLRPGAFFLSPSPLLHESALYPLSSLLRVCVPREANTQAKRKRQADEVEFVRGGKTDSFDF